MEENNLAKFRSLHDEAYLYINQGITQEDPKIGRNDVALIMYQRGLGLLDMALCFDTEGDTEEHVKARKMQTKMARSREHIHSRIIEITDILAPPISGNTSNAPGCSSYSSRPPAYGSSDSDPPPSYNAATSREVPARPPPPRPRSPQPYNTQMCDTREDNVGASGNNKSEMTRSTSWEEGIIIFSLPDVQIFYISNNGEVSTPSYPETLHIVKFARKNEEKDLPPAFIELGAFTYPLVPGKSAILKSDYGGYILPDLEKGDGSSIGMILPDNTTQHERARLDQLFLTLTRSSATTSFKTQAEIDEEYKEYKEFSGVFAEGIVKGAEIVGKGMVKGAVKTSELLFLGTDFAKQYVTPEQAKNIDPRLMKGLEIASTVSHGACRVSGYLVSKIGSATMKLGRLAAPHLERGATKALTHISGQSNVESNNQLKIAGEIASGTLAAVSTLYMALENSSKILAKNIANNTVMIVSHKYGTDAAAVTNNALSTAGNSYLAFYNAAALGPKGVAKKIAKDTGKAMIGFDPSEVNARASRAPDSNIDSVSLLEALSAQARREKKSIEDKTNKILKRLKSTSKTNISNNNNVKSGERNIIKKASSDKSKASSDKSKASSDKKKASSDKSKANSDKSKANSNKSKANSDFSKASSDKSRDSSDKSKASSDKSKASSEKSKDSSDKNKVSSDKSKASSDKSKASSDNSKASSDKSKASSDKSKTSSDKSKDNLRSKQTATAELPKI